MTSTKRIIGVITVLLVMMLVPVSILAEFVLVERVIDGETFITSDGTLVKIIGINTPGTGGQEATELAKFFLQGNTVWLLGNNIDNNERRVARIRLSGDKLYSDIVKEYGYDKETKSVYILPTDTTPKTTITKNPYIKMSSSDLLTSGVKNMYVEEYFRNNPIRTTMPYPVEIVPATPTYGPTASSDSLRRDDIIGSFSSDSQKAKKSTSSISSWREKRITGDYWFGCVDREYFDNLVGYIVEEDKEAFTKAMAAGLLTGECTTFKNGEVVYISDTSIFSGIIKVRRKGDTKKYCTYIEAVK